MFFFKHLDSTTPQLPKGYYTKKSPRGQLNDQTDKTSRLEY